MKKKLTSLILSLALVLTCVPTVASAAEGTLITKGYNDEHVIPDKYNTGYDKSVELTLATGGQIVENGPYLRVDNGDSIYFDFNDSKNKNLNGTFTIENMDFSGYTTKGGGIGNAWGYAGEGITIRYINCKFGNYIDQNTAGYPINAEFINCSFITAQCANSTFNNCYFGGPAKRDPLAPYYNCTFNNCYISDIIYKTESQGSDHVDGMQTLYGQNLYFNNCRWEVPDINYTYKNGGFSYVIYIQPQNGDAENVILDHCYLNGGGQYAISVAKADVTDCNIRIIEPFIGYCYQSQPYYPTENDAAEVVNSAEAVTENSRLHDSLYVSSVWKSNDNKLHFLVTNDTGEDRTLSVYTNEGLTTFNIPRTYRPTEYEADTKDFEDLPIDIEHEIAVDAEYAVFYDTTEKAASTENQIRYVNYSDKAVYRMSNGSHVAESTEITVPATPVIPEGDILFNASISSVFEIKIPNQIALNKEVNEIELLATADIGGTETLSIEAPNIVTLTSRNNETYDAGINLSQSILTSSELFTGKRVTMVIDCSELLPGEWNGAIDIQFILR